MTSLGEMYAVHVTEPDKERDPKRLFVTDVGKCPRQVGYRLRQTPKDYKSDQAEVNSRIMWDIADHLEAVLWDALQAKDLGRAYQFECPIVGRENWGGRGDIIANYGGGWRVIEVKSLYPGAFSYEINYPAHQYQARIYDYYCKDIYSLTLPPILWYVDRGGQNTPVEQVVDMPWAPIEELMIELEIMRLGVDVTMPPQLPRELKERSYKKHIVEEGPWQCTRCDYHWTCEPDMSKHVWAKRDNTALPYEATKAAEPGRLAAFVDSINPALEGT